MEKVTFVERVLIVFNADGTIKGVHQELLERVTESGNVLIERQLPATALDPAVLSTLLPDQSALLAQISDLQRASISEEQPTHPNARLLKQIEFRSRFTDLELSSFAALAFGGDELSQMILLKIATSSDGINLDSKDVRQWLDHMVARGVLTPDRIAEGF